MNELGGGSITNSTGYFYTGESAKPDTCFVFDSSGNRKPG